MLHISSFLRPNGQIKSCIIDTDPPHGCLLSTLKQQKPSMFSKENAGELIDKFIFTVVNEKIEGHNKSEFCLNIP